MVPQLIFDITSIDLDRIQHGVDTIEKINPHRGHMRMLDGVIHMSDGCDEVIAFKDIRDDEFWVDGHIPGRPLFPGVLMIEAAAQLASFLTKHHLREDQQEGFIGFVGAEGVKFRGQAQPGVRLVLLSKILQLRHRQCLCASQGLIDGNLMFEATIRGMLM